MQRQPERRQPDRKPDRTPGWRAEQARGISPRRHAPSLGDCPLCGRPLIVGPSVNAHHLVPRSRKGKETVMLHRVCHSAIHAALGEKELATHHHTIERLLENARIRRFVDWVRTKPPEFHVRTLGTRRRR
jgi:5-methylcytosine-specific restriction endonuclease McrA